MKPKGTALWGGCPLSLTGPLCRPEKQPYSFGLLLQIDDLGQQVRDLLLLAGGVFGFLGQFL